MSSSAPNIKSVGSVHRASAPGYFTYSSHAAMFVGFTPGIAAEDRPFLNPKYAKIFKMQGGRDSAGSAEEFLSLPGPNVIGGFKRLGYTTIGSGAVAWFNPETATAQALISEFHTFYFPGRIYRLSSQLAFIDRELARAKDDPVFVFLNIGETHVPYYFEGAPWDLAWNPCEAFGTNNDADECRRRQAACLEFVDDKVGPLLDRFQSASTLICADHGDAWGEDGLWEHGICHPKVIEVPLVFRLNQDARRAAVPADPRRERPILQRAGTSVARRIRAGRPAARRRS